QRVVRLAGLLLLEVAEKPAPAVGGLAGRIRQRFEQQPLYARRSLAVEGNHLSRRPLAAVTPRPGLLVFARAIDERDVLQVARQPVRKPANKPAGVRIDGDRALRRQPDF